VLQRALRGGEYAPEVDVITRSISSSVVSSNGFGWPCRTVHQHIRPAERRPSFQRALTARRRGVSLDRNSVSAIAFNALTTAEAALSSSRT